MLYEIKLKTNKISNNSKPVDVPKKNLILEIKKFIDEINEFMANNKYSSSIDTSFDELFMNIKKEKYKNKKKHIEV